MKKQFICALVIAISLLSLTGCTDYQQPDNIASGSIITSPVSPETTPTPEVANRFQLTGDTYYIGDAGFDVVIDTQTKNLYLRNRAYTYRANYVYNLTPLYDENGEIEKAE